MSDAGPVLAADGRPLKRSLNRALRRSKLRALALIAPLLIFVLVTFIAPIADMLFRSVENQIVGDTLPRTVARLGEWDAESGEAPDEALFRDFYFDFSLAEARKDHTKLGSRLNYETTGMASLFRQTGRKIEDVGEHFMDQFTDVNRDLDEADVWVAAFATPEWFEAQAAWARAKRASEGAAAAQAAQNTAADAEALAAQAAEISQADIDAAIEAAAAAEAELGGIEVGTDAYVAASGRLTPIIARPAELQAIVDGVVPAAERAESAAARAERTRAEIIAEGITEAEIDAAPSVFVQEEPALIVIPEVAEAFPFTASLYAQFAQVIHADGDSLLKEDPEAFVFPALYEEMSANPDAVNAFPEAARAPFAEAAAVIGEFEGQSYRAAIIDLNDGWGDPNVWATIKTFSPGVTSGYFLASADLQLTPEGVLPQPEDERVYIMLFIRTLVMSLIITGSCILIGYPVAYHLATIRARTANLLMILVLLPFWTSLLVRTSAWKALLQQQGVINDLLVWYHGTLLGKVLDPLFTALCYVVVIPYNAAAWVLSLYHRLTTDLTFADVALAWPTLGYERLALINNQTGTIIAMTHILLPFMILPLFSVMKTIPPTYVRAAKSLGATPRTAFWRVYFPQSVPGIGAGSILVFILAIGYYITPEIVGGTKGVFISNRIAYHISSSLNWGLAAALGSILLIVVLGLYWTYDRIVGIDNVKLGG